MIPFKIDHLVVERDNETGLYKIDGKCNTQYASTVIANCSMNFEHKELIVNVTGFDSQTQILFSESDISFDMYGRRDYLNIIFKDNYTKMHEEKGGICIRDTNYPPPYRGENSAKRYKKSTIAADSPLTGHELFSSRFTVEKVEITRDNAYPDNFKTKMYLSYDSPDSVYSAPKWQITNDGLRRNLCALTLHVTETNDGDPHTGILEFPEKSLALGEHTDRGISVIISKDPYAGINWLEIEFKKMLFFIC